MLDRLQKVKDRYEEITALLSDPAVLSNQERFRELSKEHSDLTPLIKAYDAYRREKQNLAGLKEITETSSDQEMKQLAESVGAKGINIAGICCTSNEILMRHGIPVAGNFLQQELALVQRDLRYYEERVKRAVLVAPGSGAPDRVHFGAVVEVRDESGAIDTIAIVGEDEADAALGKISWVSPLAKALLNAELGELVRWRRPAGLQELEILSIREGGSG